MSPSPGVEPKQETSGEPGQLSASPDASEVELGGGRLVDLDEQGEPPVMTRPKPRGLLAVPPEVEGMIAREEARLSRGKGIVPTPEARQRMVDSLTLQYYYEGYDVAYRL